MTIEELFKTHTFNVEWLEEVIIGYNKGEYVYKDEVAKHLFGHPWVECDKEWQWKQYDYDPREVLSEVFARLGFVETKILTSYVWLRTFGVKDPTIRMEYFPFKRVIKRHEYGAELSSYHIKPKSDKSVSLLEKPTKSKIWYVTREELFSESSLTFKNFESMLNLYTEGEYIRYTNLMECLFEHALENCDQNRQCVSCQRHSQNVLENIFRNHGFTWSDVPDDWGGGWVKLNGKSLSDCNLRELTFQRAVRALLEGIPR